MNSGVYIHIPFCIKKCNYCDFNSSDCMDELKTPYVDRLLFDIKSGLPKDYDSVFIGGGTPSSLPLSQLVRICDTVAKKDIEFTVEVNPSTLDYDSFYALKNSGVNRISFGLQSANDDELMLLGRIHSYRDFLLSYNNARRAGFTNINIDVMFSLPNQTLKKFKSTLKTVADLSPQHISCYSLIIEKATPFYNMELTLPTEEEDRQMYMLCIDYLAQRGYKQYEISNFAKEGYACRHNLKYWERCDYHGFGAGAHSLINNVRYENSSDISEYILNNIITKNELSFKDIKNEFIFLGLRKTDGISLDEYNRLFKRDFEDEHCDLIKKYNVYCKIDNRRFFLTTNGLSISNTIICDFME